MAKKEVTIVVMLGDLHIDRNIGAYYEGKILVAENRKDLNAKINSLSSFSGQILMIKGQKIKK